MPDLDTLRVKYPHLGFALYAYEPGGPVTLECISAAGEVFTFHGATAVSAILAGFPEEATPPAEPTAPEPPPPPPPPPSSVFD